MFSEVKEIINDLNDLGKDRYTISKIVRIIDIISTLLLGILLLSKYYDCFQYLSVPVFPLLPTIFRVGIKKYAIILLGIKLAYFMIFRKIFTGVVIYVQGELDKRLMPMWDTLEDLLELVTATTCCMFILNSLIEFYNGYSFDVLEGNYLIPIFLCQVIGRIIYKIYIKNSNEWFCREIKYTNFFDSNGRRIAQDDQVIYYNKIYNLSLFKEKTKDNLNKSEWYLVDTHACTIKAKVSLEEAVKDEQGCIQVCDFDMGKQR